MTFIKNRNLEGSVPTVGAPVDPVIGANYGVVGEDDEGLVTGKYYVEYLERDLIADTITVSLKTVQFDDEQLDKYLGKTDETVVSPYPPKMTVTRFEAGPDPAFPGYSTKLYFNDPNDPSITQLEFRSIFSELYVRYGGWEFARVKKFTPEESALSLSRGWVYGATLRTRRSGGLPAFFQLRAINQFGAGPWSNLFAFTVPPETGR